MLPLRLINPQALDHPVLRKFFEEASSACKNPNPKAAVDDMAKMVNNPSVGFWIAGKAWEPEAVIAVILPENSIMAAPQIFLAFSRSREAMKAVTDPAIEFCRAAGYNKAWGINCSDGTDETMQRLFDFVGFVRPLGTILEYDF